MTERHTSWECVYRLSLAKN